MAQVRNITPGYVVIHPNREKAACKLVRLIVVVILLASVALMLILTIGGWSKLAGMKPLNFIWALLYLVFAFYIWRWARGLLPIAAALGDPAADRRRDRRHRADGHQLVRPQPLRLRARTVAVRRPGPRRDDARILHACC